MEPTPEQQERLQALMDTLEQNGMAGTSTTDGYIFMFKREVLSQLVLTGTTPDVVVGVQAPGGGITKVKLSRSRLQMELDANMDAPELLIFLTNGPVKN
jgi:hypothetical protein